MKTSFLLNAFGIATLCAVLSFSSPIFGDDSTEMLSKASDLVHQAWNPSGDPPSNAQRTTLLTEALKLAQEAPQHQVGGHRMKAIADIKTALAELQRGDPDHKAVEFIHDANSELRTALSLAN